ncbi:MAG: 23S rRNA (pseudouridine(1915)-N(3))-methyltransferase RlmH [Clostridiales bacterium]|nr:23S rRNA (pseudouridine(1915)-N(3))-methyltransferase RlmH [Clostridiales bacterium]
MKITIITVGKLKEEYYKKACQEYQKRLTSYHQLTLIEVPDEKAPEKLSNKQTYQVMEREGKKIIDKLKERQYIIALERLGKQLSSVQLSKKIEQIGLSGKSDIVFIIGGSLGLSDEVINRADLLLSFSLMTFPHQLMKVILLEQLYRATKISKNEPYHK